MPAKSQAFPGCFYIKNRDSTDLRQSFYNQDSRHYSIFRKWPTKRLIDRHVLDADRSFAVLNLHNFIDQQNGGDGE